MFAPWQSFADARPEMDQLRQEMSRLFDRFGTNSSRTATGGVSPSLNLWDDEATFYVEAELPGINLDDIEIYVTGGNKLTVKGDRKMPETQNGTWHRRERSWGTFSRLVELPSLVDSSKVTAEFQYGVLTISLPKCEEAKPRRISVNTKGA